MSLYRLAEWLNARNFVRDVRGLAAVEFAVIFPVALMLFFGTIEVSTGVAVDRKVIILTRTLSDLISQAKSVTDTDISNAFNISSAVMAPYSNTPVQAKISQVFIDSNGVAKVKWSKASNTSVHSCNEVVTTLVPPGINVAGTYLIMSEVAYDFTPAAGMSGGSFTPPTLHLSDRTFTRPRQTDSVAYPSAPVCN
ncbi:pilus assembly protein [[Pseudomonas] carboxydohydrogena]|uniref:Pilus assembly protein n=1 Tax=Afipia carboxydohydrogena TaxID=290 RepID=A0ABY8BT45_AFICR|nr:TadE/TadG family type IV pilus assembly protein [[Pseudomonas] carboxydohydrogena]WEF52131.1 pilus assembly protein [[Pseudomonas] carboxydohydrogena]